MSEKALADTDYSDLIAVDKMRLLNKAYPLVWNKMILQPLYQQNNLQSEVVMLNCVPDTTYPPPSLTAYISISAPQPLSRHLLIYHHSKVCKR